MDRMLMLINRDERQLRSKLESSKAETFASCVITDFLYGAEDGSELGPSLQEIERYAELRKWTSRDWTDLLKKYVVVFVVQILKRSIITYYIIIKILHRSPPHSAPRQTLSYSR